MSSEKYSFSPRIPNARVLFRSEVLRPGENIVHMQRGDATHTISPYFCKNPFFFTGNQLSNLVGNTTVVLRVGAVGPCMVYGSNSKEGTPSQTQTKHGHMSRGLTN